jgi:hypothetical protein
MKSEKSQIERDRGLKNEFLRADNEAMEAEGQLPDKNGHHNRDQDS